MRFYSGIGSRSAPAPILTLCTEIAEFLQKQGFMLRSGGAEGCDASFEAGAGKNKQIFLPWKGFNGNPSQFYDTPETAFEIARSLHPAWGHFTIGGRKCHARNVLQILGPKTTEIGEFSEFVVCYTFGGQAIGGTRTAILLAMEKRILVFNLGSSQGLDRLNSYLSTTFSLPGSLF